MNQTLIRPPSSLRGAAGQPRGDVELRRVPAPRGVRVRRDALQLHVDRRQPPDVASDDGQHRPVEARFEHGALQLVHHEDADG